jgi:hypothetical protein
MFGIDVETFNTLWPSIVIVALMISVMGWAGVKVIRLIANRKPSDSNPHGTTYWHCSVRQRLARLSA